MINRIYIGGLVAQFPGKNKLMQYIKYQRDIPCVHRAAEKVEARKRRSNDQRIWERQIRCEEGLRGETKRVSRGYKLKRR